MPIIYSLMQIGHVTFLIFNFLPVAVGIFWAQSKDRKVIQGSTVSISAPPVFFASLPF